MTISPSKLDSSIRCISGRCVQRPTRLLDAASAWNDGPNVQMRSCAKEAHIGHVVNVMAEAGYKTIVITILED